MVLNFSQVPILIFKAGNEYNQSHLQFCILRVVGGKFQHDGEFFITKERKSGFTNEGAHLVICMQSSVPVNFSEKVMVEQQSSSHGHILNELAIR